MWMVFAAGLYLVTLTLNLSFLIPLLSPLPVHLSDPGVHELHRDSGVSQDGPDRPPLHLRQLHNRPLGLHPPLPQCATLFLGRHLLGPLRDLQGLCV